MPTEFDQYAAGYRALLRDPIRERFAPGSAFFAERKWMLLSAFLKRRGIRMESAGWLDVGCGQGELLRLGKPFFAAVAGCDLSREMLAAAPDLNVSLQESPDRLPYQSGQFDLVTAVCVYHHVASDEMRHRLSGEIRRVLKPRGIFCVMEHNPFNPATRLIVRRTPVDADAHLLTAGESRALLAGSGFRVLEREFFLYLPERMYRAAPFVESWLRKVPLGGQYAVFGEEHT
jgi:SAM-dependent methyltransferase